MKNMRIEFKQPTEKEVRSEGIGTLSTYVSIPLQEYLELKAKSGE